MAVALRPPVKKMKKRKELDALSSRRSGSGKRSSSQELLSSDSCSDDNKHRLHHQRPEYCNVSSSGLRGGPRQGKPARARRLPACRACALFLGLFLLLGTAVCVWLLFVDVRQQLTRLRAELDQVMAESQGLPDALQTCHTLDRTFRANLSRITEEMRQLNGSLGSFSGQVAKLQRELGEVQVSLKEAPELTSVPATVKALQNSIGDLDIKIQDLQTSCKMVKDSTMSLQDSQAKQGQSLAELESTLRSLANATQQAPKVPTNKTLVETGKLWDAVAELRKNLTLINQTLTTNITWAQEDIDKDHKKVVSLQDMAFNASAQILTLQQECVKKKDQEILENLMNSLTSRIDKLSSNRSNEDRPQSADPIFKAPENSTDKVKQQQAN